MFICLLTSSHQTYCLGFQAGKCTSTKVPLEPCRICVQNKQRVNLGSPYYGCYDTKILCGLKRRPENDSAALQTWVSNASSALPLPFSRSNPKNQERNEKQKKKVRELI